MKILALGLLFLLSSNCLAQKNLIKNGEFEQGTENWQGDALQFNRIYKNSGAGSGMINQFVGNEWKGVDQIAILPKKAFAIEFSVYIKSENIEGGKEKYNAGIMTIEFTGSNGQSISYENIAEVHGTTSWTLYKKTIIIPANAKKIRTLLALAQTSGTIYFDDVKAIVFSEEEYNQSLIPKQ